MKRLALITSALLAMSLGVVMTTPGAASTARRPHCDDNASTCAEVFKSIGHNGEYVGHDEPAVLFYSNAAGSGNSMSYRMTLPTEPPTLPTQDGTGGTYNFMLHPTFWLGMALCNDQSDPNPGGSVVGPTILCQPDSNANIYNSPDPSSSHYIGRHPGTAFLELQFYPPGWVPLQESFQSCTAIHWCVAVNIWSLADNENTGQTLNPTCTGIVGEEYDNFAFITKSGKAQAPANPVNATAATFTPDPTKDLFMKGGDQLTVNLHDTSNGLFIGVNDLTSRQSGSMTASAANGFGEVQFAPTGRSCTNIPYNFHPMYSTSSTNTRVPWAAHSYNISFSDEIGHFEYCNKAATGSLSCAQAGVTDPSGTDGDDNYCFNASQSTAVKITGCTDTDFEFDGVPYQNTWPGTFTNSTRDASLHPAPVVFSSPLTHGQNYSQVGFEADLPRIEFATNPPCQRHLANPADPSPGSGCVNPPVGANFYPIYSTGSWYGGCAWQEGGTHIPGTKNDFGGSSATEFGTHPLALFYPNADGGPQYIYEDFRTIVDNPCPA